MQKIWIWGWGKMGENGEKKLQNSCLEKTSRSIIHLNCLELLTIVYSNLKISTGHAIWANVYIFSYSMTSLTEIFTSVKHVASWCSCLIYVACQKVES